MLAFFNGGQVSHGSPVLIARPISERGFELSASIHQAAFQRTTQPSPLTQGRRDSKVKVW
jgi:hypothetical protein